MDWRKVADELLAATQRLDKAARGRQTARGDILYAISTAIYRGLEAEDLLRSHDVAPWPTPPDRFEDVEG